MTTFTTQDRQDAQRTPLSIGEIVFVWSKLNSESNYYADTEKFALEFARAIERAHGIGE